MIGILDVLNMMTPEESMMVNLMLSIRMKLNMMKLVKLATNNLEHSKEVMACMRLLGANMMVRTENMLELVKR